MKERNFKFRKSFADVIRVMDDKQAGKFIKAVSDYVFNGRAYEGNDTTIKSAFTLIKVTLDTEKNDKENGKRGGKLSAEMRKEKKSEQEFMRVITSGAMVGEILKDIVGCMDDGEQNGTKGNGESVVK